MKIRSLLVIAAIVLSAMTAHAVPMLNGLGGSKGFGEQLLARGDDNSSAAIDVSSVFPHGLNFYGETFGQLYVNNNGNVTLNSSSSTYNPYQLTGSTNNPVFAPFFADVDTRAGTVTPSPGGNSTGSNRVYWDLAPASGTVTVTWDDVGRYSYGASPNAFQLQITNRDDTGNGNFDFSFLYENLIWYNWNARAGWNSGNGTDSFEFSQSGTSAILTLTGLSNVGVAGRFDFQVRNEGVEPPATVPEPSTFLLAGAGITILLWGRRVGRRRKG